MKKTILFIVFLFIIIPCLIIGQDVDLRINAHRQLVKKDTAKYAYKNYLVESWEGQEEQYFNVLEYMKEIIDSINVQNKTDWLVEYDSSSFIVLEQIRKEISGKFICLQRTSGEIIFYAEGFFRPKFSIKKPGRIFVLLAKKIIEVFREKEIKGRAFFFINYHQDGDSISNEIKFYLTTNDAITNLVVKSMTKNKAKEILNSVVETFKLVGNK